MKSSIQQDFLVSRLVREKRERERGRCIDYYYTVKSVYINEEEVGEGNK